ncbi:Rne/Rng family ribonuclease [Acidisphaera sp. L21]|uniref:Rne/Rng family ribonuclease n=1 Tax=Acidisphaera sp. L21 TaxID=1641851 RepID=UPI00131E639E|nr:Rne/Rng family ribonuclease [Acidisphaera sp. L21]
MTKRMLIDATHAEETRVVVLDGNRLEDFDVETAAKKQLKGNIYLAKVVRVEPSLQAAFVEYGGGRHGFLAFGEIHPDYYQIPVADRQRLLEMQEAEARAEEEAEDAAAAAAEAADHAIEAALAAGAGGIEPPLPMEEALETSADAALAHDFVEAREEVILADMPTDDPAVAEEPGAVATEEFGAVATEEFGADMLPEPTEAVVEPPPGYEPTSDLFAEAAQDSTPEAVGEATDEPATDDDTLRAELHGELETLPAAAPESADSASQPDDGDDADEDEDGASDNRREPRQPARFMRSYKIQEVIRRRQILLVQVVKEERGTKGAALTTFISLAGRFSVLMPNSPRGGGISRKITSAADRRRLKEVTAELQIPRGMGMIIRTAGAARPKAEIKRDCEYLLELWDSIRETTMASIAPALIHEEANLIKRAIRDNYSRDVEEVLVDGEAGWRAARDFMRMLMPAHARKVILWNEPQPLFARQNVESYLDAMLQPTVQLRSGGYLVINQTEALVAIDVNSGRSTRERGIEETALKTNLEAADEVARQLRLRDLAGLIVIDFIDMESRRNNAAVEKRMKDALKEDRARIQIGSISQFGLLELSRQRLRPSLAETSFTTCPHCGGTGHVRTTETAALAVLRAVEDEGAKRRAAAIVVHVAGAVALYVLNHKRQRLAEIEARYMMSVSFAADESLLPPETRIERLRPQTAEALVPAPTMIPISPATPEEDDLVIEEADSDEEDTATEAADETETELAPANETVEEGEARRRKRRRRRRGGRREDGADTTQAAAPARVDPAEADQPHIGQPHSAQSPSAQSQVEQPSSFDEAAPATPDMAPDMAPVVAAEAAAEGAEPTEAAEGSAEDDGRARRRGRRGGRRRRKDSPDGEAAAASEPGADAPSSFEQAPAPYTGPTPADPFGQVFDIFDIMDAHESADVIAPAPKPVPEPVAVAVETLAAAPELPLLEAIQAETALPEPTALDPATSEAEASAPVAPESPVAEPPVVAPPVVEPPAVAPPAVEPPVAVASAEPEPAAATMEPEPTVAEAPMVAEAPAALNGHAAPEPEPAAPARAEPVSAPLPPPVLIGEAPAAEKKRGWWRR